MFWNIFDTITLTFNIVSFIPFLPEFVQDLRITRLLRVLRIFEIFPELRNMLYAVFACMSSLLWAFLLLFSFTLIMGLYLLEITLYHMRHGHGNEIGHEDFEILDRFWNGVFSAVMALVSSVTGGKEWLELASPFFHLGSLGPFHGLVYACFILFTT